MVEKIKIQGEDRFYYVLLSKQMSEQVQEAAIEMGKSEAWVIGIMLKNGKLELREADKGIVKSFEISL